MLSTCCGPNKQGIWTIYLKQTEDGNIQKNVGHHEQNETTLWIIVIDEGQKFQVNRLEQIFNKSIEENFPNGAKAKSRQD